jgi:DNA mismatch repair protein MutS2
MRKRSSTKPSKRPRTLLSDANQLIENTIREIKENKAEKEKTKTVRTST